VQLRERERLDPCQRPLIEPLDIRGQANLDRGCGAERLIGVGERVELVVRPIEHQARLVDLDLPSARCRQCGKQLAIDGGESRQQLQRRGKPLGAAGQAILVQ